MESCLKYTFVVLKLLGVCVVDPWQDNILVLEDPLVFGYVTMDYLVDWVVESGISWESI